MKPTLLGTTASGRARAGKAMVLLAGNDPQHDLLAESQRVLKPLWEKAQVGGLAR